MPSPADLPKFRYHPDPVGTGAVEENDEACVCCGQARGWAYAGPIAMAAVELDDDEDEGGTPDDPEPICPWCIADGKAAKTYSAEFTDSHPLADLPNEIIQEVAERTPGYVSWQENDWRTCCDDACAYHGDASKAEVQALGGEELEELLDDLEWEPEQWAEFVAAYEPGGEVAVHKFVCLHCKDAQYAYDPS